MSTFLTMYFSVILIAVVVGGFLIVVGGFFLLFVYLPATLVGSKDTDENKM